MIARNCKSQVNVIALIGERGREVKEFIDDILGEEGLARSVVVAAPADAPPLLRMQGANYATAIAEHFRDRGAHVLLLMDSLTRYAMAQREIALAIGEPPATKGYPPSCFAKLPQLVERSGNGVAGGGSITAFYTVLSEGDDQQDPIADAARGILDGHIVLSRELAEAGHYPAIDVEKSISRVMTSVADSSHLEAARRLRQLQARLTRARDMIQLGAYTPGHDPDLDAAVRLHPAMTALLQQDMHERATLAASVHQLRMAIQG
jgi:flagellum-specific ATP synthase